MKDWRKIPGWFDESDAECYRQIVENTDDGGEIAEIGCWIGRSTCALISFIQASGKRITVHCVDTFTGSPEHAGFPELASGSTRKLFERNIRSMGYGLWHVWNNASAIVACVMSNSALDAVFIDAAHDKESVTIDIRAWLPKVRHGGIVAGHDYNFPAVREAVQENISGPIQEVGYCWLAYVGTTKGEERCHSKRSGLTSIKGRAGKRLI